MPISHLIKSNDFKLAQLDLKPEAFESPEGKTFIATFALQALAVPKIFDEVAQQADGVFRMTVVQRRGRLRQLLRNCPHMTQGRADIGDEREQLVFCGVHWREVQRGLSGMFDGSPNTGEQKCATRDGLHPDARLGCPAVP